MGNQSSYFEFYPAKRELLAFFLSLSHTISIKHFFSKKETPITFLMIELSVLNKIINKI